MAFFHLVSHRGTLVHWDATSQRLAHGPADKVPRNVVLQMQDGCGQLMLLGGVDAALSALDFDPVRRVFARGMGATAIDLVITPVGPTRIGLGHRGFFLCADLDRLMTFSRRACLASEIFDLVAPTGLEAKQSRSEVMQLPPPTPSVAVQGPDGLFRQQRMHFMVCGLVTSNWSLAIVNRRIAEVLDRADPGSVTVLPDDPDALAAAGDEVAPIQALARRQREHPAPEGTLRVVIHQRWPVHPPTAAGDLTLAYFFYEATHIPADVIANLELYDAVLVSAAFLEPALRRSGLTRPIVVVGYPPELGPYAALQDQRTSAPRPFTFLHVSSCEVRKGIDLLLEVYASSFSQRDDVRLVIRGHANTQWMIHPIRERYPNAAPITLIPEELAPDQLRELYRDADVMVLPTRGEGFNIPAAEAIAAGLGLIVTGFGGQMDFCSAGAARLLRYRMTPSQGHFSVPGANWADADRDDLRAALCEAQAGGVRSSEVARAAVLEMLSEAAWVAGIRRAVTLLLTSRF